MDPFEFTSLKRWTRAELVKILTRLQEEKPDEWKKAAREIMKELAWRDGLFDQAHPYRASETRGRRGRRRISCPSYDRMDDNSWP